VAGRILEVEPILSGIMAVRYIIKSSSLAIPVTFFGVLFVYILSMPTDLTWSYFGGDGGEIITASFTLGIPHPPGYPTYVLLGKALSFLPFGTIAGRYHLLSAISMSVAATFVTKITLEHKLGNEGESTLPKELFILPAVAAGLIFAFMPLVWSQAIIAETYALNLAILGGLIWVLLSGRSPLLAGILFGLSLTSHLTSFLMLPLCLFLLPRKSWSRFILGSFLGLAPFFILLILANGSSPVVWGQPDNLKDWFWLVSGRLYRPNVFALAPTNWAGRAWSWMPLLLLQVIILSISLNQLRFSRNWRAIRRGVLLMLLTALIYGAYAFGYSTSDAIVLLLPALLLVSVVIGLGIVKFGRYSFLLALLIFISGSVYLASEKVPPIRYKFEQALTHVPEGAIVITPGDQTVAAIWYFAYAEEQRPDIIVVDDNLFQFSWYRKQLAENYPDLQDLREDNLQLFVDTNSLQFAVCRLSMYRENYVSCKLPQV